MYPLSLVSVVSCYRNAPFADSTPNRRITRAVRQYDREFSSNTVAAMFELSTQPMTVFWDGDMTRRSIV